MNELEATRAKLKCLELVEGTGLVWWKVVKSTTSENLSIPPTFGDVHARYEFAIGIVEGKPVWGGDTLYHVRHGKVVIQANSPPGYLKMEEHPCVTALTSSFSWNPPKPKTVMVELPLEVVVAYGNFDLAVFDATGYWNCFSEACRKALEELK